MKPASQAERTGDLEITEQLRFQRRSWKFQRWGQQVIVLLVLAALLGLFGGGLLGETRQVDPSGRLQVSYPRFARAQAAYGLVVEMAPELAATSPLIIAIEAALFRQLEVERITPEPEKEQWVEGEVHFYFHLRAREAPAVIHFHLRSQEAGRGHARVRVVDGPEVAIKHLIYP